MSLSVVNNLVLEENQLHIHQDIVENSKQGSRMAQQRLYELYSKAMFNICYRMMGNWEEAEDMLQESFMDAFQKLNSFRFESTFGAWLKRIVVNNCVNDLRKKRVELVMVEDVSLLQPVDEGGGAELDKLSVKKVMDALQQIPDGYRVVFSLYLLEGYDHREIAEILNVSESTSKSQYMRAKNKIKELVNSN